jgi:hypothetical protein
MYAKYISFNVNVSTFQKAKIVSMKHKIIHNAMERPLCIIFMFHSKYILSENDLLQVETCCVERFIVSCVGCLFT